MTIQVLSKEEAATVSGGSVGSIVGGVLNLLTAIGNTALGVNLGKLLGGILKAL
jgi:hypothetical protein